MKKIFLLFYLLIAQEAYTQDVNIKELFDHLSKEKYTPNSRDIGQRKIADTCILSVLYNYSYVIDTITNERYKEPMILEVGSNINRFFSRSAEIRDSLQWKLEEESYISGKEGVVDAKHSMLKINKSITYSDIYYSHITENITQWLRVKSTDYYYNEKKIDINRYQFKNETDTIVGYIVQRVEIDFRGRKWNVWFSLELPYNYGPWKFMGLPGLILKVEDKDKLFCWEAVGIEQPQDRAIYQFTNKLKPSFNGKYGASSFNPREIKKRDFAKLWERQWLAGYTLNQVGSSTPELNIITPDDKIMTIPLNMGNLPNKYYPKLDLDSKLY